MAVIYRHLKPCGEVFYIGIGKKHKRAYAKSDRSNFWKDTVKKYGYEVQILKSDLTWDDAVELEIILIAYYGRRNLGKGTLVNLTDGGEGTNGAKLETRIKIIDTRTGKLVTKEEASKEIGISPSHLYSLLKGKLTNYTYYVYEKNYKGEVHYPEDKLHEHLKVINIKTKEIFNSMISGARSIGMSTAAFQRRMKGEVKNNTPFVLLNNYVEGKIKYSHYVNYICTKTLKTFATVKECGDYLGINSKTLSVCLNPDRRENNSTTIMLYKDYLTYGIIPPHVITKENIKVINKDTKEIFESIRSAAISVNMDRGTLRRKLKGKSKNDTPFMLLSEYEEIYGKVNN